MAQFIDITPWFPASERNQANEELRDTIRSIWPLQAKKMLDLLIPRNEGCKDCEIPIRLNIYVYWRTIIVLLQK